MEIGSPLQIIMAGMSGQLHNKEDRQQTENIGQTMASVGVMLVAADLTTAALGELTPSPTPAMNIEKGVSKGL